MPEYFKAILASLAFFSALPAFAGEIKLRVAHTNAANEIQDKGLQKFDELLKAKTNGTLGLEIFAAGILGDEAEQIEGVMMSTLDLSMTSNALLANYVEPLQLFDLPFLFSDISALSAKIEDPQVFDALQSATNAAGFQLLAIYSSGLHHIMSKNPVNEMADLSGVKIRTMQNPIHLEAFRAYGANPTPMVYSEVYDAMQSHVIDGAEQPATAYAAEKFYELAPNYATLGWMNMTAPLVMSKAAFDALPDDQQSALMQAGAESARWQHDYVQAHEEQLLADLAQKNITITQPDTAPFRAASQPLYQSVAKTEEQQKLLELLTAE